MNVKTMKFLKKLNKNLNNNVYSILIKIQINTK